MKAGRFPLPPAPAFPDLSFNAIVVLPGEITQLSVLEELLLVRRTLHCIPCGPQTRPTTLAPAFSTLRWPLPVARCWVVRCAPACLLCAGPGHVAAGPQPHRHLGVRWGLLPHEVGIVAPVAMKGSRFGNWMQSPLLLCCVLLRRRNLQILSLTFNRLSASPDTIPASLFLGTRLHR